MKDVGNTNIRCLFIVLGMLTTASWLHAQSLTGKVTNTEKQPVVFANVIVMNGDSVFMTGSITDENGQFRLSLPQKAALVKISYIGYQDQVLPIRAGRQDLGNILLREDTHLLSEVVVKGDLPKTRIKGEAMVTTVAGSLLEKAGTAVDVLSKVPGVTLKGDDLHVFGRGVPQVYINGREVRDPSELAQLTSDNIRSVEVIANPGVRYDKTVKAVIRVQTRKRTDDGFGFADRANVTYNDDWSYLDQLNLYYRQNKIDLTGMLSYTEKAEWRRLNVIQPTYLDHYWEQKMRTSQSFRTRTLTGNITLNYAWSANHSIGIHYRYRRYPKSANQVFLQTNIDKDRSFFEKSQALITGRMPETRQEGNVYYNGKISEWQINFNGTWLHTKEDVAIQTAENIQNQQ